MLFIKILTINILRRIFAPFGLLVLSFNEYRKINSNHINFVNKVNHEYKNRLFSNLQNLKDEELLQFLELKYGGYSTDVPSQVNRREVKRIAKGKFDNITGGLHTGGDRMNIFFHNYSSKYSKYLRPFKSSDKEIIILEIGILLGTGLAIWDSFFTNKKIYGFDYDLSNFIKNLDNLMALGAFKKSLPIVKFFDQFADNSKTIIEAFDDNRLDVVIDDAFHTDESIINTFIELQPYFNDKFVYFIEDNLTAFEYLERKFSQYKFENFGELTIVTNK